MGNYYPPFSLRVPEEIIGKVKQIARCNKRSANKEIEYALQEYITKWEDEHGTLKESETAE